MPRAGDKGGHLEIIFIKLFSNPTTGFILSILIRQNEIVFQWIHTVMIYFFLSWSEKEADVQLRNLSPLNDKSSSLY
jgi:hypothetical protein